MERWGVYLPFSFLRLVGRTITMQMKLMVQFVPPAALAGFYSPRLLFLPYFLHRTQLGIALFAGQFIIASRLSLCVWPYHFSLYSQVQNEREWESGVYTTNHSMTFLAVGGQSDRFLAPPAGSWSMRRLFSIKLFPPFFAHQPPIWSISEWDSSVQKQKE